MRAVDASTFPVPQATATRAWQTPLELAVLGAIWGASFMFMRIAAPEFGTLATVELRLALGSLVLLPFLWKARARFTMKRWPLLALIGAINSAVPFALFAWAAQRAPAGIGAITNSMAVLFTALVGFLFYREKIGTRRGIALLVGFTGVIVLASGKVAGASVGWAAAAGCTAALMYGIGAHLVKRHLADLPPAASAASTLLFAAIVILPFAIMQWPQHEISHRAWGAALMIGVFCTGVAYAMYYRLVQRIGAGRAVMVTYLVPLFAVTWAWLVLGEALTLTMGIAAALILGSVALSQKAPS